MLDVEFFRRENMFNDFFMTASHSRRPLGEDQIFKVNQEAKKAAEKYGEANVINSSVGVLLDDYGKHMVLPTVIDILRSLDAEDFSAYAPIAGLPDFLETAKKATFREFIPSAYIEAVATPGGTGAIRHAIWNYSEYNDIILTADWYWGPYKTIADEHGRKLETFRLFDDTYKFNMMSFSEKVRYILNRQKRIVILMNFPANNPTGYNLDESEWENILYVLKQYAKDRDNKIVLFVDIAYIDYAGKENETRKFMKKFENLPENMLVVMAFSMSKGYTMYGMRSGAMIGMSSSRNVAMEFRAVNEYSNRGVWSNGTRPAMAVLKKIYSNSDLLNNVEIERDRLRSMLSRRAAAFIDGSKKSGLFICPYKSGFFISIPCVNSKEAAERLKAENIFVVPMQQGIRFAVCSVAEKKCAAAPAVIARVLKTLE